MNPSAMEAQTFCFPAVQSDQWRPPPDMSCDEFAHLHSMRDMAQRWHEHWPHLQVITHRFKYHPGLGLPENGISTLEASAKEGYRNHEFDIVPTSDGHVVDHDFSPMRTTGIKVPYAHLAQEDVVGRPVLIRQFQNNDFSRQTTPTHDKIVSSGEMLERARQIVPHGSFLPDCRDNDIGIFAAWISKRPHHAYTLLMFYTFTIISGHQLVEEIEKQHPHPEWRQRLKFVLNLYPSELVTLARRYGMPVHRVDDLVAVGKKLLLSHSEAGIPLFGLLTMCSGIAPNEVEDMANEEVRRAVYAELAIVKVVAWARKHPAFPHMRIGSGTRGYDVSLPQADGTREFYTYNLKDGNLVPWPIPQGLRKIKQLYATPGQPEKTLRPDFLCTDAPEKAHFYCCGIPPDTSTGFRYPRFDAVLEGT